jgi:hypothetical protein
MQLPLSASALVMLGVAAVLVGALILVVVLVRRQKPASGPTRIPSDMRRPQQPVATSGSYAATPAADAPAARPPHILAPHAGPVAAAATPRPLEVSSKVDPPGGGEQVPPDRTPPAGMPAAPSRHHQAGSGRTVAAAVAQAFAVRAAAGRGGTSGPGVQRPMDPPPPEDGATAAQENTPAPDPVPDGGHVPAWDGDGSDVGTSGAAGVDPAATTDPDGHGLAAMAEDGRDEEPGPAEPAAPEAAAVSGNGWVARAAYGSNGEHAPDGHGRPPEAGQAPEPGSDGHGAVAAAGAGLLAAGWTLPAAPPAQPDPEPAAVPAPRPDNDGVARPDGSPSDARDRLLAVLLDDPERAVGATVELEACLRELDRLADAARTGRAALRDVLHRLASAGLRPDQLAKLAGMPLAEVEALLEPAPAEQQA